MNTPLCCCILTLIVMCIIYHHLHKNEHYEPKTSFSHVIQTIHDKRVIPKHIHDQWDIYFDGKRIVFDDTECIQFLKKHYEDKHVNKFNSLHSGAHKADLFRYAWLYIKGGIYCDIKTMLLYPLHRVFEDMTKCYFVITDESYALEKRIYNGIIATPPKNPIFIDLLNGAMNITNVDEYIYNCREGYKILSKYTKNNRLNVGDNPSISTDIPNIHIFIEKSKPISQCYDGADRYNGCMFIENSKEDRIFRVRDATYPWT
jgi:hypothetical protein